MSAATEYRYNRLSWPEMNEAIAMQKVVLLPTGSTEQHGRHLPLETDTFLTESVCLEVGRRAADRVAATLYDEPELQQKFLARVGADLMPPL